MHNVWEWAYRGDKTSSSVDSACKSYRETGVAAKISFNACLKYLMLDLKRPYWIRSFMKLVLQTVCMQSILSLKVCI